MIHSVMVHYWDLKPHFVAVVKVEIIFHSTLSIFFSTGRKASGKDLISLSVLSNSIVNLFHALFLSVCVGAVATPISTYVLLGIDFVVNIQHTIGELEYLKVNICLTLHFLSLWIIKRDNDIFKYLIKILYHNIPLIVLSKEY